MFSQYVTMSVTGLLQDGLHGLVGLCQMWMKRLCTQLTIAHMPKAPHNCQVVHIPMLPMSCPHAAQDVFHFPLSPAVLLRISFCRKCFPMSSPPAMANQVCDHSTTVHTYIHT